MGSDSATDASPSPGQSQYTAANLPAGPSEECRAGLTADTMASCRRPEGQRDTKLTTKDLPVGGVAFTTEPENEPRCPFAAAADRIEDALGLPSARVALSLKTNPAGRLLETARATGMLAETIHPDEMTHARRHGYATSEIVVNGPVQTLLPTLDAAPYALFGDAVSDLRDLSFDPAGAIVGVRTRPPERGPSRFGVDLSDADRMDRLCDRLAALPASTRLGLHLHAPASTLGHERWWESLERVLSWAEAIQARTGRPVEAPRPRRRLAPAAPRRGPPAGPPLHGGRRAGAPPTGRPPGPRRHDRHLRRRSLRRQHDVSLRSGPDGDRMILPVLPQRPLLPWRWTPSSSRSGSSRSSRSA